MTRNSFTQFAFTVLSAICLFSCTNEIGDSKDVNQETIYQYYSISYEEGSDKVDVFAQFRFAGENGTTLVLNDPSKVSFDNKVIKVDSTDVAGAYYKEALPSNNFIGKHQFVFTDFGSKSYKNDFEFNGFQFESIPSSANPNLPLQLSFKGDGIMAGDRIEINSIDTDSSFSVTQVCSKSNTAVTISAADLLKQKAGKITIVATFYKSRPLAQQTKEGGVLEMIYTLKPVSIAINKDGLIAFEKSGEVFSKCFE